MGGWADYQTIIFVAFMFNTFRNWRVTGDEKQFHGKELFSSFLAH